MTARLTATLTAATAAAAFFAVVVAPPLLTILHQLHSTLH